MGIFLAVFFTVVVTTLIIVAYWLRPTPPPVPTRTVRRADLDRVTVAMRGLSEAMLEMRPAIQRAGEGFRKFGEAFSRDQRG